MPRAQLNENLKSNDAVDQFDALKLETNEWARLLIVDDENAWWEWVHSMRAPVLDEDDLPIIIDKTRRDGTPAGKDFSMGFVGQRICLGDPSIVEDKGLDPDRCPACAAAARGIKGMSPERRFAVPVIKYKTRDNSRRGGGTVDLQNPPQAEILVWKLTQGMFNKLMDTKGEMREVLDIPHGQEFPLRAADVVVFCEDGNFQRITFKTPRRPAYKQDAAVAELVKALWGEKLNRPTDDQLKAACGRVGDRDYMVIDVERVEHRWTIAERVGLNGTRRPDPTGSGAVSGQSQDLDKSLDNLLGETSTAGLEEFAPRGGDGSAAPADDFFGEKDPAVGATREAAPAVDSVPAAPAEPADPFGEDAVDSVPASAAAGAPAGSGKVQSFTDILAD